MFERFLIMSREEPHSIIRKAEPAFSVVASDSKRKLRNLRDIECFVERNTSWIEGKSAIMRGYNIVITLYCDMIIKARESTCMYEIPGDTVKQYKFLFSLKR